MDNSQNQVNCCTKCFCCISSCIINCICRQCNCLIFPAPKSADDWSFPNKQSPNVKLLSFINQKKQRIPYIEVSSKNSQLRNQVLVYFHGNAQDIFSCISFLLPIFKQCQQTILCVQYPGYSCYTTQKQFYISNQIKQNSLQFHSYINRIYSSPNISIMGRSIGTGPASYLASKVKCQKLILISPFDSIRKVSQAIFGCTGACWACCFFFLIKNHFDNQQAIQQYQGKLLVIHGKIDEVINFKHGNQLVNTYEQTHQQMKCDFIQPPRMSHNYFDMDKDIVLNVKRFLSQTSYIQR